MADLLKEIFSIGNEYKTDSNGLVKEKRKIINILGIHIKLKRKIFLTNDDRLFLVQKSEFNENIINMIMAMGDRSLFYLKVKNTVFIFTKDLLKLDSAFVYNFLKIPYFFPRNSYQFKVLNENCDFYREHIEYTKKGEFCWKYLYRYNSVSITTIYNQNNEIYIKRNILGRENGYFYERFNWADDEPRKFIDGICLDNIVSLAKRDEQIKIIKKLYDFIFENYKIENSELISGRLVDCHFRNFIVSPDATFHYIDAEYKSDIPLEKNYIIFSTLHHYNKEHKNELADLYEYFLDLYKLEDKSSEYLKYMEIKSDTSKYFNDIQRKEMKAANIAIIRKYMGCEGLIPRFDEKITQITKKLCD